MRRLIPVLMVQCFMIIWTNDAPGDEIRVPVLYCTDLFHPHEDPDDHFDLTSVYALQELEIKAIILDQGVKQERRPGKIAVEQLNFLTGREIPWAVGLSGKLKHPSDGGSDQPRPYQGGVETILQVLRESPVPVTVITVGSLRDVAAAFNRRPILFRRKVSRLMIFAGDAQGSFQEHNVGLDPNAYIRMMNSGLPIHWVPCFDGGLWQNENGNASYWQAGHAELLQEASQPVLNFFIYALLHKRADDPAGFLYGDILDREKAEVLSEQRNLWCAAVFPFAANRKYILRDGRYLAVPKGAMRDGDRVVELFSFDPVKLRVEGIGQEFVGDVAESRVVNRFHINNRQIYAAAMTSVVRELIKELSIQISSNRPDTGNGT